MFDSCAAPNLRLPFWLRLSWRPLKWVWCACVIGVSASTVTRYMRAHKQPFFVHLPASLCARVEFYRRGGTHNIFGWGCAARSWKPLPYFRPKYTIFHTLFQTWLSKCIPYFRQNVYPISDDSQWIYGARDFVTPQTMFAFFFFAINVHGNTRYSKNLSQTKQTEYTPYFRPKWQNLYPILD